jgi:aspartate racemase
MPWWRPGFLFKFAVNLHYWVQDFSKANRGERKDFVLRKGRAFRRKFLRRLLHPGTRPEQVDLEEIIDLAKFPEHELKLWQTHLNALDRHASRPYAGKVILFRTRGQPLFCSLENDFGWGKLVKGGVEIKLVPGSHESIFMEPDVRFLAEQLKPCLSSLDASVQKASHESNRK